MDLQILDENSIEYIKQNILTPKNILNSHNLIKEHIHNTALVTSNLLNDMLGHKIYFKLENQQKTGSFKARGAINTLLTLKKSNKLAKELVAYSSGNHAQALAWAGNKLQSNVTIYLPEFVSSIKKSSILRYGANLIETKTRNEAEQLAQNHNGYFIHPSSNPTSILGYGTACLEALQTNINPSAIFVPCGGGGLMVGSLISSRLFSPNIKIIAGEPIKANDAAMSFRMRQIYSFDHSPETIADGAKTLAISELIFSYFEQIEHIYEVEEEEIIYWNVWIMHLLKIICEPTSAMAMAAACRWLKSQKSSQEILVIISGGNIDQATYRKLWHNNYLETMPDDSKFFDN